MAAKTKSIVVRDVTISVQLNVKEDDYISLTDIAKYKDAERTRYIVQNWIRNRSTIEFLGLWEEINNPNFNRTEFEAVRNESGLNSFVLTPKQWIERTNAIGIISKAGRYNSGTFAHKDIAFEFCSWFSPAFKLYLIKEYQRLVESERSSLALAWDAKRLLSKTNYEIHTDAIKKNIIPTLSLSKVKEGIIYATEADLLNIALFGCTAKQWEDANPELAKTMNMRDAATINQLIVLSNMEAFNSELIKQGIDRGKRLNLLHKMAKEQLSVLVNSKAEQNFRRLVAKENDQKLIE